MLHMKFDISLMAGYPLDSPSYNKVSHWHWWWIQLAIKTYTSNLVRTMRFRNNIQARSKSKHWNTVLPLR